MPTRSAPAPDASGCLLRSEATASRRSWSGGLTMMQLSVPCKKICIDGVHWESVKCARAPVSRMSPLTLLHHHHKQDEERYQDHSVRKSEGFCSNMLCASAKSSGRPIS